MPDFHEEIGHGVHATGNTPPCVEGYSPWCLLGDHKQWVDS